MLLSPILLQVWTLDVFLEPGLDTKAVTVTQN